MEATAAIITAGSSALGIIITAAGGAISWYFSQLRRKQKELEKENADKDAEAELWRQRYELAKETAELWRGQLYRADIDPEPPGFSWIEVRK